MCEHFEFIKFKSFLRAKNENNEIIVCRIFYDFFLESNKIFILLFAQAIALTVFGLFTFSNSAGAS